MSALSDFRAEMAQLLNEIHKAAGDPVQTRRLTVAGFSTLREWEDAEKAANVEAQRLYQSARRRLQ